MQDSLNLLTPEPRNRTAVYVVVSLSVHALLLLYAYLHRPEHVAENQARLRYVELTSNLPFTEAPGAKRSEPAPKSAPLSDANRKASSSRAAGERRVSNPGDGSFTDLSAPGNRQAQPGGAPRAQQAQPQQSPRPPQTAAAPDATSDSRMPALHASAAASTSVDWRGAIRDMARGASLGSDGGEGRESHVGGESGFAEDGPISFETQWYDWGEYAEGMVRRIRSNWYANMPELIKVGMKGVVTIQFTIERSGQISRVVIINSSGVPPYDNAAKKAIEISSSLAPLPTDFPNPRERVTAQFYYNMKPPTR